MNKLLLIAQGLLHEAFGCTIKNFYKDPESQKYDACIFKIRDLQVLFRMAHVTPKKIGHFVTLWKRSQQGPIEPFDAVDPVDIIIIGTCQNDRFGLFVFPKKLLIRYGVFSLAGKGGKRALRVYTPFDIITNVQANKTQKWQIPYFFDMEANRKNTVEKLRKLITEIDTRS